MKHIKEEILSPLSMNQFKINKDSEPLRIFLDHDNQVIVHYLIEDTSPIGFAKVGIASDEQIKGRMMVSIKIGTFKNEDGYNFHAFDLGWSKDLDIGLQESIIKALRNIRKGLGL